jgi:hypothetical protein
MIDLFQTSGGSPPTASKEKRRPDFLIARESNFFLLTPSSQAAHEFVANRIDHETALYFGPSVVVDQHAIEVLLRGIVAEGMVICG